MIQKADTGFEVRCDGYNVQDFTKCRSTLALNVETLAEAKLYAYTEAGWSYHSHTGVAYCNLHNRLHKRGRRV